ncbi:MAG: ATP-binding protein, partial [Solirubrobacteraceae bacterium]
DKHGFALAGEIAAETDGNPFFVGEVLRSLVESGWLVYDDTGRWRIDRSRARALPESVRDVIERRVERLGDETREILTLGAVIGRSFELAVLARLVEVSENRLLDHLEAAVAASLLHESTEDVGRFRFVHGLINQTLYEALGGTRRARIHQRVAEALEALYGPDPGEHLGELALHWRLATVAVDRGKAAYYACRAGQRALDSLAPTEAVRLFGDALELLGPADDADRCRALIGLGQAQQLVGDPAYRETLLEASRIASALGEAELAAGAAMANTRGWMSIVGEVDEQRVQAIVRALELDDRSDLGRRAQLLALQAQELVYDQDPARRQALATEAIALAREVGESRTMARVLLHSSFGLVSPETLEVRARLADDLLASAQATQDRALEFWAYDVIKIVSIESGDLVRARTVVQRMEALAAELAQPILSWMAGFSAAGLALTAGDLASGERLAEQAL